MTGPWVEGLNERELNDHVIIPAGAELWLVFDFVTNAGNVQLGRDAATETANGYSNIMFFNSLWSTLSELIDGNTNNYTIKGFVRGGLGRVALAHVPYQPFTPEPCNIDISGFEFITRDDMRPLLEKGSHDGNAVQSVHEINPIRLANDTITDGEGRSLMGYRIFRGLADIPFGSPEWVQVADGITAMTWIDMDWGNQAQGPYRYAVVAVYSGENLSAPTFSNILGKDWEAAITFNLVSTDGGSVFGATIDLVNNEDPTFTYSARAVTNLVTIPRVWFGDYTLVIRHGNYNQYINTNFPVVQLNIAYAVILQPGLLHEQFILPEFPPFGWTHVNQDGDTHIWERVTGMNVGGTPITPHTGTGFARSMSNGGTDVGPINADNWLITPRIDIPSGLTTLNLGYVMRTIPQWPDHMEVLISTTGINIGTPLGTLAPVGVPGARIGDWTVLRRTVATGAWAEYNIDLASYVEANHIYLAFRHRENDQFILMLDSVNLTVGGADPTIGMIAGVVTDITTGEPIQGATVAIAGTPASVTTNAQGIYFITANPGAREVTVTRQGYLTFTQNVTVVVGQSTTLDVELAPPASITGVVRPSHNPNIPLSGVVVTLGDLSVTTPANGRFTFNNLPAGNYRINASIPGNDDYHVYNSDAIVIVAGDAITHNFVLVYDPVEGHDIVIPEVTALGTNFPNPFNPVTNIRFDMAEAGHVVIEVYNIRGQRVKSLVNDEMAAGRHSVEWNGTDDHGRIVGSGVYFYTMRAGEYSSTRRMVLMK
jgi:hypothetical protein